MIDTQSVKTSTNVPLTSQGTDAAKKIVGRKRGILTDTIGLILKLLKLLMYGRAGHRLLRHIILLN